MSKLAGLASLNAVPLSVPSIDGRTRYIVSSEEFNIGEISDIRGIYGDNAI